MLPVQLATWELSDRLKDAVVRVRKHETEVVSCCDGHKADILGELDVIFGDVHAAGTKSLFEVDGMWHCVYLCSHLLKTSPDSLRFVKHVFSRIMDFVLTLYPESPHIWSEEELETAKAEVDFGRRVTDAMISPTGTTPAELYELNEVLEIMWMTIRRATYQSQAIELLARVSSSQLHIADQLGVLAKHQLKLIEQQTAIMHRFDEQDRKMEHMNLVASVCTIVAAVLALIQVVPLIGQFLDFIGRFLTTLFMAL